MKRIPRLLILWGILAILSLSVALQGTAHAIGRGGGGGGGRVGGGGGGFGGGGSGFGGGGGRPNMGSAPSFGARPAGGGNFGGNIGGGGRPNIGQGGAGSRLEFGGGANRPNFSAARPDIGTRPDIGNRPGLGNGELRPGAGNRPDIGNRPGIDNRPGIGNRPGFENRPGLDNRPGIADRPNQLPGNQLPGLSNRFPNAGNRLPNGGANIQDRHANLQDRFQNRGDRQQNRNDRQDNRNDRQDNRNDRQQNRDDRHQDWQNWANNYHNDWHHGYCNGGWWSNAWQNYPGWMAFGCTMWGMNRLAYGFGMWNYYNPYYSGGGVSNVVYDYSQPIYSQPVYADSGQGTAIPDQAAASQAAAPPADAMFNFEQARTDFYNGAYDQALNEVNLALKEMPNDAVVHEFRALVLFALGEYRESAATIHSVLAVGPGWDWTTMAGLYPSVSVYTQQLRNLEDHFKANPKAGDAAFLLGYHYLTCDHKDAAYKAFQTAATLQPKDTVAAEYARMTAPATAPATGVNAASTDAAPGPTPEPPPASIPPEQLVAEKDVYGKWKATGGNGTSFTLELTDKHEFTWSFSQGKQSQSVKGVYALDQNQLAMEPDSGGTMLAQLSKKGPGFHFAIIGAPDNDPGLDFTR